MGTKCSNGRVAVTDASKAFLWASSGGYCMNPTCQMPLFVDLPGQRLHFAEFAHIIAANEGGARWRSYLAPGQRAEDDNILLLCANCHKIVDKDEQRFPVESLHSWKRTRAFKLGSLMGAIEVDSRELARRIVRPLLDENRTIFEIYGPASSQRRGRLDREAADAWRRKVDEIIVPNSYRLLAFADVNSDLLTVGELRTIESFRQHVDDLAARHHREIREPYSMRFPTDLERLFSDDVS